MTREQEWAIYEARNARAGRAYRTSRCARCLRRPGCDFGHADEWLCATCQHEEARKTA